MFAANLFITCLLNSTFVNSTLSVQIDKEAKQVVSAHVFDGVFNPEKEAYNYMNLSVLELDESKVELSGLDQNSQIVRVSTSLVPDGTYGWTAFQVGTQSESLSCSIGE